MPGTPALADFIRDANGIAAASGIAWQSVTHGPPTPGDGGVASIAVGIQIRGTYEQVIDYLGRLAALRRLLVLDNVQFAAAGDRAGSPRAHPAATGRESTGPFSGASELAVTITARMFDTPTDWPRPTAGRRRCRRRGRGRLITRDRPLPAGRRSRSDSHRSGGCASQSPRPGAVAIACT